MFRNKRGVYYFNKKKFDLAIKDFTKALKYNTDAESYYYRGASYYELGEKKEACNDLKKSADLGHEMAKQDHYRLCFK